MRDDPLTRLFGSLADAGDPEPAFADTLFDQLRLEASGAARSRRQPWTLLLAAALLLVAVGAGAALASGLVRIPWLVVNPSPSPSPSPTATPLPSEPASIEPSASPTLPPTSDAVLPPSSLATTLVELPLHQLPGTDTPLEATIPAGETILIHAFGPEMAEGETWYPVAWAEDFTGWPQNPETSLGGWVAVTRDGFSTIEPVEPACPTGTPDVPGLAGMLGWERLSCLGETEITLEGSWVAGAGGVVPFSVEPAWLNPMSSIGGAIADGEAQIPFVLDPTAQLPAGIQAGDPIRIVGHHDDPAARTCSIDLEGPVLDESAQLFCRQAFVVTSVEILAP
ncbi:MAG TPA: hypothetical protein VF071_05065 [Candidatus Limnocylindria bacterium]